MAIYDTIGHNYAALRRPDPRIAAALHSALESAASVVNVGAGTGSYEPTDRAVLAIEPSDVMIRQRPAQAARCLRAFAEALPLESASFDAAMAILTIHHWTDLEQGLRELARVARHRVVILTWVPDAPPFWLTRDYFPEIVAHDRTVFPTSTVLSATLERLIGPVRMTPVPIPHDCTDGLLCAYWRRPELYLDPQRRGAMSSFSKFNAEAGLAKLRDDLATGLWAERNHDILALDTLDLGYRLFTCTIRPSSH